MVTWINFQSMRTVISYVVLNTYPHLSLKSDFIVQNPLCPALTALSQSETWRVLTSWTCSLSASSVPVEATVMFSLFLLVKTHSDCSCVLLSPKRECGCWKTRRTHGQWTDAQDPRSLNNPTFHVAPPQPAGVSSSSALSLSHTPSVQ